MNQEPAYQRPPSFVAQKMMSSVAASVLDLDL